MADTRADAVEDACRLWHASADAVLSTQSVAEPGYPFGSVVPFCTDSAGRGLLLLSHLAQHSQNLAADARCALTLADRVAGDIQQGRRLTCIARCVPCADADALERYCRHFPRGRVYAGELGFRLHRIDSVRRFHYNGGFATARWIGADRIPGSLPPVPADEPDLLRRLLGGYAGWLSEQAATALGGPPPDPPEPAGIDRWGLTLRAADQLLRLESARPLDGWPALEAAIATDSLQAAAPRR
jgi:hypothetical protein